MKKKAASKSTTPGHTKTHRTRKRTISLGTRKYSVPVDLFRKIEAELAPHKVNEEGLLTFDEFFEDSQQDSLPPGASNLRGLRYREDLTQEELAEEIGVPQSNLSAMENGRRAIGKVLAKRIAERFGTDYRLFL